MSLTETRLELADVLSGSGYSLYSYPSETMIAPCVVLVPGQPYVTWDTFDSQSMKFNITLVVNNNDNQAALVNIENMIDEVIDVIPTYAIIGDFTQPQITTIGSTDYLTSDITLEVKVN